MRKWIPVALFSLFLIPAALADDDGEHKSREISVTRGAVDDDLFTSGGTVDVDANVAGDIFAAGGSLEIAGKMGDALVAAGARIGVDAEIGGDALIAGCMLNLRGSVGDNLVAAGCNITIDADVSGKAIASAGSVRIGRKASVGGDAWLAGGQVTIAGTIARDVRVAAGNILILGDIAGDVDAQGEELQVGPGAHIAGSLTYRGPNPPKIDDTAKIDGGVEHIEREGMRDFGEDLGPALFFASLMPSLYLFILAVIAVFAVPAFIGRSAVKLRDQPLASLGLGVLAFSATPAVNLVLLITLIGIPFAAALGGLYVFALFFGIPMAVLSALTIWASRGERPAPSKGNLIGLSALGFVALWLIGLIPVIGGLIWIGATCFGIGAALLALNADLKARKMA